MNIPDFLDNGDPKTYEVLDHYLREEPRADFASGYFNRMLNAYEGNGDYGSLVSELQSFVGRYDLNGDPPDGSLANDSGEKGIEEEELELVAYLDLS